MSSLRTTIGSLAAVAALAACANRPPVDEHMAHMSAADIKAPAAVPSASQGTAGLPPSNNQAAARLNSSPRHGEWVKIPWGGGANDSLMAWIVYPSTTNAKSPVVVVIHEIYGLSTWVRGTTDQVAAEGFIAIAPDLNSRVRGGPSTTELTRDSANKLSQLVPPAERNRAIDAVAKYAMSQAAAAPRYAVIGFCYGGSTVWSHVVYGGITGFAGGVAFYGAPPRQQGGMGPSPDSLAKITKPVMMLNGAKDTRTGGVMPAVDSIMKSMNKWYFGRDYAGAEHGFVRAQDDQKTPRDEPGEVANMAALKDAWPRTVTFLKTNLGVK